MKQKLRKLREAAMKLRERAAGGEVLTLSDLEVLSLEERGRDQ